MTKIILSASSLIPGDKFNRWTIIAPAARIHRSRDAYLCRCDCGVERVVEGNSLRTGNTKSCGCLKKDALRARSPNITGMRFGRLVALERLESTRWRCRCDCGNLIEVGSPSLRHGNTTSCGCKNQERLKSMVEDRQRGRAIKIAAYYNGTDIDRITKQNPNKASTTGVKGVFKNKSGSFTAYLTLNYKRVHLGCFDTLEKAARARELGEKKYYQPIIDEYYSEIEKEQIAQDSNSLDKSSINIEKK